MILGWLLETIGYMYHGTFINEYLVLSTATMNEVGAELEVAEVGSYIYIYEATSMFI